MLNAVHKRFWQKAVEALPPLARSYALRTYTFKESRYWLSEDEPLGIGLDLAIFIGESRCSSGPFVQELTENVRSSLAREALGRGLIQPVRKSSASEVAPGLTEKLIASCKTTIERDTAYLYLKRWVISEDTKWWKIGITNNIERRETEQNVLPVPAELLACIKCTNMPEAKQLEKAMHWVLKKEMIQGANNRELFILTEPQEDAVIAAFSQLNKREEASF
jgi:hypothetical protein